MDKFDWFLRVLNTSVERNGADKKVKLGHLRNIANLAVRLQRNDLFRDVTTEDMENYHLLCFYAGEFDEIQLAQRLSFAEQGARNARSNYFIAHKKLLGLEA